ncbi:MAG: CARDB domain-containing protein [Haloferacaceae archaeon]
MASVSTSHLILFIASMVIAAGVAGTFVDSVSDVSAAIDDQSLDVSQEVRGDVEIISDAGSQVYDNSTENVTIHVKNTGTRELTADSEFVDVLVDGEYRSNVTVTVVDGSAWAEHNVARLEISVGALDAGDHRVKVVVDGDEEVFRFRL